MDKQEELKLDYIKKDRFFEDKEDQLTWEKSKIFQEIEDYVRETEYWAKQLPFGEEALSEAHRHFQNESMDLEDLFHQERKKILKEKEELEQNYRRELRNVEN